jgi:phospholipid transport system transporter-binding protein
MSEGLTVDADGVVSVAGSLTAETVAGLLADSERLFTAGNLTIDLSRIAAVDSAGLALLIEWSRRAHGNRCQLRYTGAPGRLRAIAAVAEITSLLDGSA